MALSLAADRLLELLLTSGRQDRERLAAYLDDLAADAEALAAHWGAIVVGLDPPAPPALAALPATDLQQQLFGQTATAERVDRFYRRSTLAFRGRVDAEFRDSLLAHVAGLLQTRQEARARAAALIALYRDAGTDGPFLADAASARMRRDDLRTLTDLLLVVHREAGAVRYMAREFRARM